MAGGSRAGEQRRVGAFEQRMARAHLDHRSAAHRVGAAATHHGRDAEQRQVVALEDIGRFRHPLVRIAVELVDFLDMGDGIEQVLGERLAGAGADEAMAQLRCQRHHVGDQIAQRFLVEMRARSGSEKHRVARLVEKPLEIGEQRLRVLVDGGERQVEHFGMIVGEAGRREALHGGSPCFRRLIVADAGTGSTERHRGR